MEEADDNEKRVGNEFIEGGHLTAIKTCFRPFDYSVDDARKGKKCRRKFYDFFEQ